MNTFVEKGNFPLVKQVETQTELSSSIQEAEDGILDNIDTIIDNSINIALKELHKGKGVHDVCSGLDSQKQQFLVDYLLDNSQIITLGEKNGYNYDLEFSYYSTPITFRLQAGHHNPDNISLKTDGHRGLFSTLSISKEAEEQILTLIKEKEEK